MTKAVIHTPFLPVRQDFVGLVDLFEPGLGLRILVDIRMVLASQAPESLLDLFIGGVPVYPKYLVKVTFGAHARSNLCSSRFDATAPTPNLEP
jgi:hypothetical protein